MEWADLNQYERANARMQVEGYMISRRPNESDYEYFLRAKTEALRNLQLQVDRVRCMSFGDMYPRAVGSSSTGGGEHG